MSKLEPTDRGVFVVVIILIAAIFICVMTANLIEYAVPEKVQIEMERTKRYDRLIRMLDYSTSQEKEIMLKHVEALIKAGDFNDNQVKEIREQSLRKGDGVGPEPE